MSTDNARAALSEIRSIIEANLVQGDHETWHERPDDTLDAIWDALNRAAGSAETTTDPAQVVERAAQVIHDQIARAAQSGRIDIEVHLGRIDFERGIAQALADAGLLRAPITPAQVEAAAEGMWDRHGKPGLFPHAPQHYREAFLADARAALTFAAYLTERHRQ